jgi:glycosyltransferase involved in cell wall biosynthesis
MAQAYREADLLIFLSEYESFGNVVVESILCGTPVIATDIPSMKEIFQSYPDFLVTSERYTVKEVMEKLKDYVDLVEKCEQAMGEFELRFSQKQHIEKLGMLYAKFKN